MRCAVDKVVVVGGAVTGVQLSDAHDKMYIPCSLVVSSVGYFETMGDGQGFVGLVEKNTLGENPEKCSQSRVEHLGCSDGFTMCNVSIQGATAEQLGLTAANVWYQVVLMISMLCLMKCSHSHAWKAKRKEFFKCVRTFLLHLRSIQPQ